MSEDRVNATVAFLFFAIITTVIAFIPFRCAALNASERYRTITVEAREATGDPVKRTIFLSEPDAAGITEYRVQDSISLWNFDSATDYNKLKPGGTYRVKVFGWRANFPTMYPIVTDVQEVNDE